MLAGLEKQSKQNFDAVQHLATNSCTKLLVKVAFSRNKFPNLVSKPDLAIDFLKTYNTFIYRTSLDNFKHRKYKS